MAFSSVTITAASYDATANAITLFSSAPGNESATLYYPEFVRCGRGGWHGHPLVCQAAIHAWQAGVDWTKPVTSVCPALANVTVMVPS